jgi:hypothetical protein
VEVREKLVPVAGGAAAPPAGNSMNYNDPALSWRPGTHVGRWTDGLTGAAAAGATAQTHMDQGLI